MLQLQSFLGILFFIGGSVCLFKQSRAHSMVHSWLWYPFAIRAGNFGAGNSQHRPLRPFAIFIHRR